MSRLARTGGGDANGGIKTITPVKDRFSEVGIHVESSGVAFSSRCFEKS